MTKIVFSFAGTGSDASNYSQRREISGNFKSDVIRVYFKGCQNKAVGNGIFFPDLDRAAKNIRQAFQGNQLNLQTLQRNFGSGIYQIKQGDRGNTKLPSNPVEIDAIALEGFSRGAVTTFAVAKALDELNIPIDILANQPVPGETQLSKKLFKKYHNLTSCRNIRSAVTILAKYYLGNNLLHNYFFRQMIAKFPTTTTQDCFFTPHQAHLDWFNDSPIGYHIHHHLMKHGYSNVFKSRLPPKMPLNDEDRLMYWYTTRTNYYFTPSGFTQMIYGVDDLNKIPIDPFAVRVLTQQALEVLQNLELVPPKNPLTAQQAEAILAVSPLERDTKKRYISFILSGDHESRDKFIKIVNTVSTVCFHLKQSIPGQKKMLIHQHKLAFKRSVFDTCYQFLNQKPQTAQSKAQLIRSLREAELQFRANALSMERGPVRLIIKLLVNFITHVTGIGLILNAYNKTKTGNWLFFKHNCSVSAIRQTNQAILPELLENSRR